MREIKFRAWDADQKRMYSWDELCGRSNSVPEAHPITCLYSGAGWEVMQFTGLTDKNKKEIYEGDIVLAQSTDDVNWEEPASNYVVSFSNATFVFKKGKQIKRQWNDGSNEWYAIENVDFYDAEIVGNIYENPDLIQ